MRSNEWNRKKNQRIKYIAEEEEEKSWIQKHKLVYTFEA